MGLKFANCDTTCMHNGRRVQLHENEPWDADDPFVKARPELFAAEPPNVRTTKVRTARPSLPPVEDAVNDPAAPARTKGRKGAKGSK